MIGFFFGVRCFVCVTNGWYSVDSLGEIKIILLMIDGLRDSLWIDIIVDVFNLDVRQTKNCIFGLVMMTWYTKFLECHHFWYHTGF
jgi:hypothetical protein